MSQIAAGQYWELRYRERELELEQAHVEIARLKLKQMMQRLEAEHGVDFSASYQFDDDACQLVRTKT